jgi:CRISPR system Cascade subunit CasA
MSYSLLAEPWLPLVTTDGSHQQGSLREALLEPSRWAGLDSAHPLQCLALYRLLLAISHRAIGPADTSDDRAALLDNWPAAQVAAYLNRWSNRFDLFDADRPFMQNPVALRAGKKEVGTKKHASLASLQIELSSGNNRTLWDRSFDSDPLLLSPARQACALITHQQFAGSGTIQGFRTSGSYGLASNLQLVMPVGSTLQQTLALNLIPQVPAEHKLDLPCWERELPKEAALRENPERLPAGPADRYTFCVRALLLRDDGLVHIAEGEIPAASPIADPMSAVVQGSKGPMPLMLRPDRMLWRDATVLIGGAGSEPPAVLKHAAELLMASGNYEPIELLAGGLVVDKGRGLSWRLEQRHLASRLVGNAEAQAVVEALLEQADTVSKALFGAISALCRSWLDQGSEAGVKPEVVTAFQKNLQHDALFWGSLETEFWGAMHALGDGTKSEAVLAGWRKTLRLTVRMVWDHCCTQIGNDGRSLRAQGLAGHAFGKVLAGLAEPVETSAAHGA